MSELTLVASLFGPLFVGLIFHGLCIKFGWLRSLAVPIDRGALFRGRALFGANKTCRGVIVVALGSAAGYSLERLILELQPAALRSRRSASPRSASRGGPLPCQRAPQQVSQAPARHRAGGSRWWSRHALLLRRGPGRFLLGAWLVACPWVPPTPLRILWSILFVLVVHQVISGLGALLGMRDSAR